MTPTPTSSADPGNLGLVAKSFRAAVYLWAAPTTLIGLAAALLSCASGGRAARVAGVLEVWGGLGGRLLRSRLVGARAMTLGHVVLGRDRRSLTATRPHERAHVRQAERWGPFFIPAYCGASLWAWLCGRHYYRDNWFELDAERRAAAFRMSARGCRDGSARATAG
jgi:hypothetical protein